MPSLPVPAIAKADCFCIRPRSDVVDSRFLMYQLGRSATRDALIGDIHGATRPRVTTKQLRQLEILLPPLAEQKRIVATVDALLAQVAAARHRLVRVREILKRFRQSVLAAACSGRLTGEWRQESVITCSRGQVDGAATLPASWTVARLGSLATVGTGATPLRKRSDYYSGAIPWLKSACVKSDPVVQADEFITDRALAETNAKVFPVGTLLMAMYGEGATRGTVTELGIPAATNQALAAIVLPAERAALLPYQKLALQAEYQANRELSAGGVQPNLSLGLIRVRLFSDHRRCGGKRHSVEITWFA